MCDRRVIELSEIDEPFWTSITSYRGRMKPGTVTSRPEHDTRYVSAFHLIVKHRLNYSKTNNVNEIHQSEEVVHCVETNRK